MKEYNIIVHVDRTWAGSVTSAQQAAVRRAITSDLCMHVYL